MSIMRFQAFPYPECRAAITGHTGRVNTILDLARQHILLTDKPGNGILHIILITSNQLPKGKIPFETEILSKVQQLNEYIMTSLRTSGGINLEYISETGMK